MLTTWPSLLSIKTLSRLLIETQRQTEIAWFNEGTPSHIISPQTKNWKSLITICCPPPPQMNNNDETLSNGILNISNGSIEIEKNSECFLIQVRSYVYDTSIILDTYFYDNINRSRKKSNQMTVFNSVLTQCNSVTKIWKMVALKSCLFWCNCQNHFCMAYPRELSWTVFPIAK